MLSYNLLNKIINHSSDSNELGISDNQHEFKVILLHDCNKKMRPQA